MNSGSMAIEMRLVRYGNEGQALSLDGLVVPITEENLSFLREKSPQFFARLQSELVSWFYRMRDALSGKSLNNPAFETISLDLGVKLLQNNRVKEIRSRLTENGEKHLLIILKK